jgi:hypothetical protein
MAEAGQQVNAVPFHELLPELRTAPCQREPGLLGPADKSTVERQRFPRPAGRWKIDVGRAVAPVTRDRLHPAAHPDPCGTGCRRAPFQGRYSQWSAPIFQLEQVT